MAGLVLAAGASARMGRDKALLRYPGPAPWPAAARESDHTLLLAVIAKLAVACAEILVVLGHHAAEIERAVAPAAAALPARFVRNPDPARGQFSSLRCGVQHALARRAWSALVLAPVDHPDFAIATVESLLAAARAAAPPRATPGAATGAAPGIGLVKPRHEGRDGHPVVLLPPALAAIAAAGEDDTLRRLQTRLRTEAVAIHDPGVLLNIDAPADWARLRP